MYSISPFLFKFAKFSALMNFRRVRLHVHTLNILKTFEIIKSENSIRTDVNHNILRFSSV
jgi:hypothetical protein